VTYKKSISSNQKSNGNSSLCSSSSASEQEEIDRILDKISEKEYESLSTDEKQKLFNANKK